MLDEPDIYKQRELFSCSCTTPPLHHQNFEKREIGIDKSFGAYGEVSFEKCKNCKRLWLLYLVEMEWHSKSDRWFRGVISEKEAETITPKTALDFLESLDFILYGGSYFDGNVKASNGTIITNHFAYRKK